MAARRAIQQGSQPEATRQLADGRFEYTAKWNGAARAKVTRGDDRWTVEMAIPWMDIPGKWDWLRSGGSVPVPFAASAVRILLCRNIVHTRPEGEHEQNACVFLDGSRFPTPGKFATLFLAGSELARCADRGPVYALTQIAGGSLHDYLKRRVLEPIGITQFNWQQDATGKVLNWTGGIEISAEDLARFGLLFLNRGNWNGRQLINADWVDQATRVQVPPSIPNALPASSRKGSGVYGYHWWPNGITPEGRRRWPNAPPSAYSRSGYNNNDLFVIPAWNMVTVRLGLDEKEDQITSAEYNTFLRMVGEAILEF